MDSKQAKKLQATAYHEAGHAAASIKLVPIVPRADLFLVSYGHGDEGRFAGLFAKTWRRLPLWARRRLLKHWREDAHVVRILTSVPHHQRNGIRAVSPRVELVHGWTAGSILWPGDGDHDTRVDGLGKCFARGHRLRFHAPSVDRMPEDVVQDLIAHELAHVYQEACGMLLRFGTEDPKSGLVEEDADEMMNRWGFDPESIDEWAVSAGLSRLIVFADFGAYLEYASKFGRYA